MGKEQKEDLSDSILKAKLMYFQGRSKEVIAKKVGAKQATIMRWIKEYDWRTEKFAHYNQVAKQQLGLVMKHISSDSSKTLQTLQVIKDKVETALQEEDLKPKKFTDAVSSFLETIKLEKQLKQDAFQFIFITEMLKILRDEIQDEPTWQRVGNRVGKLLGIDKQLKFRPEIKASDVETNGLS